MGVYTRLYAPIFSYIHMAQAEKTDTQKEPRLYNRGNDQIDLDDYIRNLESGFDAWLNSRKIKDKYKDAVREAYREMVTRLNSGDGSFTSMLGGGFQDSTGKLRNADKGFDATGIAASYLGSTLRSMSVYKKPESSSKYEDGAIGAIIRERLLGSAGTIQDFIDRDQPKNGVRSNIQRSKDFKDVLEKIVSDLRTGSGKFSNWTEDQRTKSASDLEGLFTIFNNDGQVTDDEYLQLAKGTGIPNLREWFSTTTVPTSDRAVVKQGRTYADKIRRIEKDWKPWMGELMNPIIIGKYDMSRLGPTNASILSNALNNASVQDLTDIIQDVLQGKTLNTRFVSKNFNGQNPFGGATEENVRNFLLSNAIQLLKNKTANHRNGLHNYGESNPNTYYIAGTRTDRNTAFIYDDANKTISEVSIHDIPYWQNYINNWWDSLDESGDENDLNPTLTAVYKRKNGGTIKKLATGGSADYNDVAKYNLVDGRNTRYMYNIPDKQWIQRNLLSVNTIAPNNKQYNSEGNVTEMQSSDLFKNWVKDLTNPENKELAKYWAENYLKNHQDKKIADFWRNKWYTNGVFDFNRFIIEKGLNGRFVWDDNLGGVGHDMYAKSVWYNPEDKMYHSNLVEGYEADGDWTFDKDRFLYIRNMKRKSNPTQEALAARRAVVASAKSPTAKTKEQLFQLNSSIVNERDVKAKDESNDENTVLNTIVGLAPNILSASRLLTSIRANNRIAKTIRPSLKPVLKDTYERYSPVTGAFSQMQLRNRQAADVLSASYKPFTSDAELAAARMLEGQRQANELQAKGFLVDDQEIKRTQEQALARQEDNIARRSEAANFNRASINQVNRELAQLEATRINKNWRSWDNFLSGIEKNLYNNKEALYNAAVDDARVEMENAIEPYQIEFRKWLSEPENSDITKHPEYPKYLEAVKKARNTYRKRVNQASLYYAKQGGVLQPKQQDFIAQIIKLNNERNS